MALSFPNQSRSFDATRCAELPLKMRHSTTSRRCLRQHQRDRLLTSGQGAADCGEYCEVAGVAQKAVSSRVPLWGVRCTGYFCCSRGASPQPCKRNWRRSRLSVKGRRPSTPCQGTKTYSPFRWALSSTLLIALFRVSASPTDRSTIL